MRIAITGASGFLGRHIVAHLAGLGHDCVGWHRPSSNLGGMEVPDEKITWVLGELGDAEASRMLVEGCDAVVHAALHHPGGGFMGGEGDLAQFVETNVVGTIRLIQEARRAGVGRFVFISTCAVHDVILEDRLLDETHPTWAKSHYGAHKAAIEAFVSSFGRGQSYPICALRPTGIYGLAYPPRDSKWFNLITAVARGEDVTCRRGGKEVHARDVARAVESLLTAEGIAGEAYNCYDLYVAEHDVASIAREITGSRSEIRGTRPTPKNQIVTRKLQALGMSFGGRPLLEQTVRQILEATS
jgi:nucleoside-diphosphate-sugar epimerase